MHYLNIHTHIATKLEDVNHILSISIGHDQNIPANQSIAVGIHPWFARANWQKDLATMQEMASMPHVKMIGECGLDKLKGLPLQEQIALFEAQLEIAKEVKKPLIIHCVKAYDELIACYKKVNPAVAMVIHGFKKNEALGRQLIAQGYYLSFGKAILNRQSDAAKLIASIDEFFLETDDATLSIQEIYKAVADLKNISVDELKALIFANWKKLNLI
jgi:TatD DNase family protein